MTHLFVVFVSFILSFFFTSFPLNAFSSRIRRQQQQQQFPGWPPSSNDNNNFNNQQEQYAVAAAAPQTFPFQFPSQQQQQNQQQQQVTAYSEPFARILLALSAGAYAYNPPNGCDKRWIPDSHLWNVYTAVNQTCDFLENKCSSYTVVSEARREMIVVFRGTKTKEQLFLEGWQSLQPGTDFYGIGKVNKYFFRALNSLWPSVDAALRDPRHSEFKVTFTGHSLGGALASLSSIRTVLEGLRRSDQVQLYTFGQPRVGNPEYAFKHDQLVPVSFRIVHRMDIVPHMPACAKTLNWPGLSPKDDSKPCDSTNLEHAYHHGIEIWYPYGMRPGDRFYECVGQPRDEDFLCSDSLSFEVSKYEIYVRDHRHYFDHKVPAFGKLGCELNKKAMEEAEPNGTVGSGGVAKSGGAGGVFASLVGKVQTLGRIIGLI